MNELRNRKRRRIIVLLLLIGLIGGYVAPRLVTTVRFFGTAHEPSVDGEFTDFENLLPEPDSTPIKFHAGLPHNFFDKSSFIRAVWLSRTKNFHGYRFFSKKWLPSGEFTDVVAQVLTDPKSFRAYRGPKLCGGYHADFLAQFETSQGKHTFLVCLGCHEVIVVSSRGSKIVELSTQSYDILFAAWKEELRSALP